MIMIKEEDDKVPVSMRKPTEMLQNRNSSDGEQLINSIDANLYLDAFYGVLNQVLDTPYQKTFFDVLQHLRDIQLFRHPSGHGYIWDVLEKFVCRLKQLRSPNEARELLMQLSYECGRVGSLAVSNTMTTSSDSLGCCCSCHRGVTPTDAACASPIGQPPSPPPLPPNAIFTPPTDRKKSMTEINGHMDQKKSIMADQIHQRPTFAEIISNAATQRSMNGDGSRRNSDQISPFSNRIQTTPISAPIRTPPPPPPVTAVCDSAVTAKSSATAKMLSQPDLPQPKTKLKTLAWSKVPTSKIIDNKNNVDNVWLKMAKRLDANAVLKSINFEDLETLFAAQISSPVNTMERRRNSDHEKSISAAASVASSVNRQSGSDYATPNSPDGFGSLSRRRDTSADINLLDPKRSLNVNIFLKQFRSGIDDLIELIETGDSHYLGLEKLRGLMKILPEPDELEALKAYAGDKCKLGNAERFFLALVDVSNYRLRIESMLLKEEFISMVEYMKPSINTLISAARDLKNSQSLQEVLYLVLLVGNYLNAGGYGGNAAGFKMTSLWKLVEIRANKPNVTLLHYVVAEIEKRNRCLLDLPKELKHLDDASKLSFDTILSDFRHLKEKTERISKQVTQANTEDEIRLQTEVFFEFAKNELIAIERDASQVECFRLELAEYFCEDAQTFKLEDCFKVFSSFCQRFARAIDENMERRLQEEKAELRRRFREQQKANKELAATQRSTETESSRRLSDKYKSLLNTPGDIVLPYQVGDSSIRSDLSIYSNDPNLIELLTSSTSSNFANARRSIGGYENSHESEFSVGFASWRRSYNCKRRSIHSITSSTFTNRDRPRELESKSWRQRSEEDERGSCSTSSNELCTSRFSDFKPSYPTNVDKPSDYSPIVQKPFRRSDSVRVSSINDLDQLDRGPENQDSQSKMAPVELRRSLWREHRRKRATSLLSDVGEDGGNSANDLNELLEIMKIENESNAAIRRRGSMVKETTNMIDADEREKSIQLVSEKTDIDEVVRHCEQAKKEIDSIGQRSIVKYDPPIMEFYSSTPTIIDNTNQSSITNECKQDFQLSTSSGANSNSDNLTISCAGTGCGISSTNAINHLESIDRPNIIIYATPLSEMLDEGFEEENSTNCSSVAGVQSPPLLPASPKLKTTQQPKRNGRTPINLSHNPKTISTGPVDHKAPKSVSTTGSQTRFSYQSGTKSSSMKISIAQNGSTKGDELKSSNASVRRSSANKSIDQRSNDQVAKKSITTVSTSKMGSRKNSDTTKPLESKPQVKRASLDDNQIMQNQLKKHEPRICKSILENKPTPVAKTRIQTVPLRISSQRQRLNPDVHTSSLSSGSDSENQFKNQIQIRRRLPVSGPFKNQNSKEYTPVQKGTPPTTNRTNWQTSVLTIAPRSNASTFRQLSVRKNT